MNTILICLIICSVYSLVIYQILSRKVNKKIDNKTFLKDVKEEINLLITQINETSDRNVLLIENRLEKLNSLLSASDKKISLLKKSLEKETFVEVLPTISPAEVTEPITEEFIVANSEDEPESNTEKKEDIVDDPSLSRRDRILLLYKQGISPTIIASQTKTTIGEVELIISLNRG